MHVLAPGETPRADNVGRQYSDGRCEQWIILSASDSGKLTPAQARELASALVDAADEADSRRSDQR